MADALMIGHMGKGQHLVRAQAEYMKQRPHPYLQLVKAVMDNNLLSGLFTLPCSTSAYLKAQINVQITEVSCLMVAQKRHCVVSSLLFQMHANPASSLLCFKPARPEFPRLWRAASCKACLDSDPLS